MKCVTDGSPSVLATLTQSLKGQSQTPLYPFFLFLFLTCLISEVFPKTLILPKFLVRFVVTWTVFTS